MTALFADAPRWIIASHNPGKIKEIADLLAPHGVAAEGAGALGLPEPEETETTFEGNARLKARAAARASGEVALADDSGLSVDGLDGAPGVYSARWAGPEKDFDAAMRQVHEALAERPQAPRTARFVCVLALAHPDGTEAAFTGTCEGRVVWPPRGDHGFGYDPIFQPKGREATFAEMEAAEKRALSHRGRAFARMMQAVFGKAAPA